MSERHPGRGTRTRPDRIPSAPTCAVLLATLLIAAVLAVAPGPASAAAALPLSTGSNALGQLGDAAIAARRTTPGAVDVPAVTAIASGRDHAYALDADGPPRCRG